MALGGTSLTPPAPVTTVVATLQKVGIKRPVHSEGGKQATFLTTLQAPTGSQSSRRYTCMATTVLV
jgi:hypothetical protein